MIALFEKVGKINLNRLTMNFKHWLITERFMYLLGEACALKNGLLLEGVKPEIVIPLLNKARQGDTNAQNDLFRHIDYQLYLV